MNNKMKFEADWKINPDQLNFQAAISADYGVVIPNLYVCQVGPYKVWKEIREGKEVYYVSKNHAITRWLDDLSKYL